MKVELLRLTYQQAGLMFVGDKILVVAPGRRSLLGDHLPLGFDRQPVL